MDYVSRLLSFLPERELQRFALHTQVNKYSKKLQGTLLFKLLFYCILTDKENSLRGMQSALESSVFCSLIQNTKSVHVAHSSISERLSHIKPAYFEKVFKYCVEAYQSLLTKQQLSVIRFDSTIIALSSKLLHIEYHLKGGDAEEYRMLKFTIGYRDIPDCVYFYSDQKYTSENAALQESMLDHYCEEDNSLHLFDRGITSRANYDELTGRGMLFISRIDLQAKCTFISANTVHKNIQTATLIITEDRWAYLYSSNKKKTIYPVRIIKALRKEDGKPLSFITNNKTLKAAELTEIYRSRWQIEVFFKFLKQHLNFAHLLNRSENGVRVVVYVILTAAILLEAYKKEKQLKGYKIAKKKFCQDMERDIIYNVVILCGGNARKAKQLLYQNTS
ncbi:MAG: IS4 family transposase [Sphingobacteriales bacterium]|nr:IS4 family transposase [Sphingobacteriales bacterium]